MYWRVAIYAEARVLHGFAINARHNTLPNLGWHPFVISNSELVVRMFRFAAHPSRIWRALAALVVLQPVVNAQFAPAQGRRHRGRGASAVAIADFNEDGIPDLAIANFQNGTVTVMLGNGTGGFVADTAGGPFKVGAEPASMVAANFNGHMGLAVANEETGPLRYC